MAVFIYQPEEDIYTPKYLPIYRLGFRPLVEYLIDDSPKDKAERQPYFQEACALLAFHMIYYGCHRINHLEHNIFLKYEKDTAYLNINNTEVAALPEKVIAQVGQVLRFINGNSS